MWEGEELAKARTQAPWERKSKKVRKEIDHEEA